MKHSVCLLALLALLIGACGDAENEYSSRSAYLRFDNSTHLNPALTAALNANAANVFCRIWLSGANVLTCQTNHGASEPSTLVAEERQRPIVLGINNATGIIVGYGYDGTFYCYDAACPNCYNNGKTQQLLSMNPAGIATCGKCGRQYDMSNHGLSPQGGKLERYYATSGGPTGLLLVNNRYY